MPVASGLNLTFESLKGFPPVWSHASLADASRNFHHSQAHFAKLAKRQLKRGVFRSVVDLQATINRFVAETNNYPKPFTWTADPNKIIAAVRPGHQVLDSIH